MEAHATWTNRRQRRDRRVLSWRTILFGHTRSRRRHPRRSGDAEATFLDWYHPWLWFLSLGIMLLCCVDAFMTLELLQRGMIEANPFMALAIEQGAAFFALSKVALTGVGIVVLVFLARIHFLNWLRTGLLLTAFFSLYCSLVCYQVVNFLNLS